MDQFLCQIKKRYPVRFGPQDIVVHASKNTHKFCTSMGPR